MTSARLWQLENPDLCAQYRKKWADQNKEKMRLSRRRWAVKNAHKRRAHDMVSRAIKSGSLKRLPCESCNATENVHAHHSDYNKPLVVEWLCGPCHKQVHSQAG